MPPARIVFYAATLAGILFTVHAILKGPPSLVVALITSGAYVGIILCGVFILGLRMFADAIIRGPKDAKGIVLTFDDGPDPVHTRKVLDILDKADAKATFFVIGHKAERHPEVVKEIVKRGHEVGVHGYEHDRLFSLRGSRRVRKDLEKAVKVLEKITKKRPTLFRPPIGHTNPTIARIADQLELTVIGWTAAGYDGIASAKANMVASRVERLLDDGVIVLLHDAAERDDHEPVITKALPQILDAANAKNLKVTRLTDWLDDA
jgi:peptidoglycan-N-acetylglucosamine deacetylase